MSSWRVSSSSQFQTSDGSRCGQIRSYRAQFSGSSVSPCRGRAPARIVCTSCIVSSRSAAVLHLGADGRLDQPVHLDRVAAVPVDLGQREPGDVPDQQPEHVLRGPQPPVVRDQRLDHLVAVEQRQRDGVGREARAQLEQPGRGGRLALEPVEGEPAGHRDRGRVVGRLAELHGRGELLPELARRTRPRASRSRPATRPPARWRAAGRRAPRRPGRHRRRQRGTRRCR